MTDALPLISVIMPVYNGERFLVEAVESLRAQHYTPLEIILVNDGSTDGTAEIVRSLGDDICYLSQSNQGAAAARNRGLETARGEIIGFLDVDDLWPPDKLAQQLPPLLYNRAVDLTMGYTQLLVPDDRSDATASFQLTGERWLNPVVGAWLCRRKVFDRVGLFNPALRLSEDVDWFMRAREQGLNLQIVDAVTLWYRQHGANITQGKSIVDLRLLEVLHRSLERRRQDRRIAESLSPLLKPEDTET
jgi:glycosyltransferase involved in cell wall biosynthesis